MFFVLMFGCSGDVIVLTDGLNHHVSRDLHLPVFDVDSTVDLLLDPSQVQSGLRCLPVDERELVLELARFPEMTPLEIERALERGSLKQSDQDGILELALDGRAPVRLSEMTFFGSESDFDALGSEVTFVLALREQESGRQLSVALLEGVEGQGDTTVVLEDGCGLLEMEARIADPVVRYRRPEAITWTELSVDAFGDPYAYETHSGSVEFAYFAGLSPRELAEQYLWLDTVITERWTIPVDSSNLAVRRDELEALSGMSPGDGEGTWVLALTAGTVPSFLTTISD